MSVDVDKLAKAIAEAAEEYERRYGHLPSKAKVTLSKAEVISKHAGNLVLAERAEARRYRRNLWMSPWHENAAYLPS